MSIKHAATAFEHTVAYLVEDVIYPFMHNKRMFLVLIALLYIVIVSYFMATVHTQNDSDFCIYFVIVWCRTWSYSIVPIIIGYCMKK